MEAEILAALVDVYSASRTERLVADKAAKKLKEYENELEAQIIEVMQKGNLTRVGGLVASVTLQVKDKPIVRDWAELYAYIKDNDAFELLHKRLTEGAVAERAELGENVPGLGTFVVHKLTVSKV